jgi:hypothetical protein
VTDGGSAAGPLKYPPFKSTAKSDFPRRRKPSRFLARERRLLVRVFPGQEGPCQYREVASRFGEASMGQWLVRQFIVFGIHGQNWMLVALAIILIAVALSCWWNR